MRVFLPFQGESLSDPVVSERTGDAAPAAGRLRPDALYLQRTHDWLRNHEWYEHPRLTVNDLYAFDPSAKVSIEPFIDIIGRHFKQPPQGL